MPKGKYHWRKDLEGRLSDSQQKTVEFFPHFLVPPSQNRQLLRFLSVEKSLHFFFSLSPSGMKKAKKQK
jgi:hypothetical protein